MKQEDEVTNSLSKKDNDQHEPEHRVLLLDHCCDSCVASIVGKRIHCEKCQDFDLCFNVS